MIFRQIAVQLVLRSAAVALAIAGILVVPYAVSSAEFGRFALALSACQLGAAVLLSWPNLGTLRYGREEFAGHGRLGETYAARLAIHAALLAVALVGAIAFGPLVAQWFDLPPRTFTWLVVAAFIVLPLGDLGAVAAQTIGRFVAYGLSQVLVRLAQFAALLAIAIGLLPAVWTVLVLAAILGWFAAASISWSAAGAAVLRGFALRREAVDRIAVYGRPMVLAKLAAFLVASMDLWFIKAFLGVSDVGIYAWAYAISLLATTVLVAIGGVLAPRVIDARIAADKQSLAKMANVFLAVATFGAALMPLAVAALGCLAATIELGAYGAALAPALIILAGTTFQLSISLMDSIVFAHERLVSRAVAILIVLAGVNALVDVLLIPRIGIAGAAIGTAAAFAVGTLLQWAMVRRELALTVLPPSTALVVFGCLPVAAAVLWPTLPIGFAVLLSAALTIGLILVARRSGWFLGFAELRTALPSRSLRLRAIFDRALVLLAGPILAAEERS